MEVSSSSVTNWQISVSDTIRQQFCGVAGKAEPASHSRAITGMSRQPVRADPLESVAPIDRDNKKNVDLCSVLCVADGPHRAFV